MPITICQSSINKSQKNSQLETYVSKKKKDLGQLIVIGKIKDAGSNNKKIIKQIIEESKNNYFNSLSTDSEKALEDALQKINFSISEIVKQAKKDWLDKSEILIIALNKKTVHFAKIGKINGFLISNKEIISITEDDQDKEVNPIKSFANIYSGELLKNQAILFVTENILDYIAQEKLRKLSLENSCDQAIKEIKNLLKKAPNNQSFGMVLIKKEKKEKSKTKKAPKSPKKLNIKKEKNTEIKAQPRKIAGQKKLATIKKRESKKNIASRKNKQIKKIKSILIKTAPFLIVGIIAILTINLLFNSSDNNQKKNNESVKNTQYQLLLQNIQNKFIQAQNLLIMDKRLEAENELKQVVNLINQLPEENPPQQEQKQALNKKVQTQLLLAHGVSLNLPTLLWEIKNFTAQEIILKENKIYTFNSENNDIYTFDLTKKTFNNLTVNALETEKIKSFLDHSGTDIYFLSENKSLIKFDLVNQKLTPLKWEHSWSGNFKANIYQNKLYALTNQSKIFKYTASLSGFTQETAWLKQELNLTQAQDIAIDGAIWVLKNNGNIIKLFKGKKEEFNPEINPSLSQCNKIFTDLNLNYLYLLDPPTKRIIILNKSGKLIKQFTAQEFTKPQDLAVDESNRRIYILDQNKLFQINF